MKRDFELYEVIPCPNPEPPCLRIETHKCHASCRGDGTFRVATGVILPLKEKVFRDLGGEG